MRKISRGHFFQLVLLRGWADFRAEASRTWLGVLWWVADPLLNMVVLYIVFGVFFQRRTPNFVPFLLIGLVFWRFFNVTVMNMGTSILNNVGMIRQVALPKILFPMITLVTCTLEFFFTLLLLVVVLVVFQVPFSMTMLWWPMVFGVQVLGCGLTLAAFTPFVPDLNKMVNQLMRILFYMSGIFYDVRDLPEKARQLLVLNPMVVLIDAHRACLMDQRVPDWQSLALIAMVSLMGILFGWTCIRRFNPLYAKRIAR
ncbi:MAG TPA: ABC transporter permease [Candidatus Hydrogenedentes bacterium]|nr:ABC transporter permease [Candidatus Hydrogenedentota bacterium]